MANLRDPPRVAETASSTSLDRLKPATRSDIARNFAVREQLQSEVYLHVRCAMRRSNIISVLHYMQVKLQAGIQLPPITQRLVFYESVEKESQALEERRRELVNKLNTLSDKRKEVETKWDQVWCYILRT